MSPQSEQLAKEAGKTIPIAVQSQVSVLEDNDEEHGQNTDEDEDELAYLAPDNPDRRQVRDLLTDSLND